MYSTVAAADRQVLHPIVGWDEDELTRTGVSSASPKSAAGAVEDDGTARR